MFFFYDKFPLLLKKTIRAILFRTQLRSRRLFINTRDDGDWGDLVCDNLYY